MAEAFLAFAVGATVAIVMLVPFAPEARAGVIVWTLVGATLARARLSAAHRLRLSCDGVIEVHVAGRVLEGRVVAGGFVAPWLTIVAWRPRGAWFVRTLVLLPGTAPTVQLRAIRVILRWA